MNKKLDYRSRIREIYENPIGHDIIYKLLLQLNKKEAWITNPVTGNLRLKTAAKLTGKLLGAGFFETLLELLNSEPDLPDTQTGEIIKTWWKQAVFYQIYPRSFQDSDGDGIGDLNGILSRLDYLKELGIDAVWLSPVYDSPNDDNGYDIRDYYAVMKEFGTMEDFDRLLKEVHARGMKLVMDLVVNHTSDEHPWFQAAVRDTGSEYKDFYLFKKSEDGKPPNNWTSFFGGPAWNYYGNLDEWGLHLFSKKQMDLNWENEKVRTEIQKMIRWWLVKGVDGFRLDVINYISKKAGLPQGNESIGKLMGYYGIEHYFYGPRLHQYLKELRAKAFEPFDAFTVGETPGAGMEMAKLLTAQSRKELDMIFSFDHLETPGHDRFDDYRYDLNYLKKYICNWMEHYGNACWMSLFYENHDNPRMISKINPDPACREVLAKLLALLQLTLKGTPFLYQGQEIGSINHDFRSVGELRDVESINLYQEQLPIAGAAAAMKKVLSGSRDHSRTPMQWSSGKNAGFSEGTPWISTDEDYKSWNVEEQSARPDSVLNFYKRLIWLRRDHQALIYGSFESADRSGKELFTYFRKLDKEVFYVECNLSGRPFKRRKPVGDYRPVLSNYSICSDKLRPYEANLYQCGDQ
jgi:oligo-1,6-glucosidase